MNKLITNRTMGELPLSQGTAVPMEVLLRGEIVAPYTLWLNVRTLIRNITDAVDAPAARVRELKAAELTETLLEELQLINDEFQRRFNGTVSIKVFFCEYKQLTKEFPKANLKTDRTTIQKSQTERERSIVKLLPPGLVTVYANRLEGHHGRNILLSHYPIDLLSAVTFAELKLIESFTGKLKGQSEWGSKLNVDKPFVEKIPFNRLTWQVFGDGVVTFGFSKRVKGLFYDLAVRYKWDGSATRDKIIYSLESVTHEFDRQAYLDMYRAK